MRAEAETAACFPIARYEASSAFVAFDGQTSITVERFLGDVHALAALLPDAEYVVNLCADRYRFAVGFFAALIRAQTMLLPSSEASGPLERLKRTYPSLCFLCDSPTKLGGAGPALRFPDRLVPRYADQVPAIPAARLAAILFTSGSTGEPAPHARSWGAMVQSARGAATAMGLAGIGPAHVFGTVPHQHSYGLESVIMLALQHGWAFHRRRALLPGDILTQLEAMGRPRILVTTPVHLRSLIAQDADLPCLDRIICATAPLSVGLAAETERRFRAPLHEIYGCTEIGQMAVRRTVETQEWTCIPGIALRERGGEVWAGGSAAATEAALNDEVELIGPTRFLLKDRKSDVVNVAGKRSSLAFLNQTLNAIEGVTDGVFIVPKDSGSATARLAAYVVAPGLSAHDILSALRRQLDPAFLPRPIHLVDVLPRNALGKLPREALFQLETSTEAPWLSVRHRFAADHPTGAGHFPGDPIIPGALLLDRMLRAIGETEGGDPPRDVRVAKFLSPVRPGTTVVFRWRRREQREIAFECRLADDDRIVLKGVAA